MARGASRGCRNALFRSFKLTLCANALFQDFRSMFIIQVLIGGLLGYMLARGIGGGMIPRRREEKRKREERARGMKHMASDLGTLGYCIPKLMESRAHQSASLVPLCFAQKQAAGIVSDSSTLRDGSRLDSNRGQYGEKRRRKEGKNEVGEKERRRRKDGCGCRP